MTATTADIDIRSTTVDQLRRYGQHLFTAHVDECEPDMAHDLAPDWESYEAQEKAGRTIVLAAESWGRGQRSSTEPAFSVQWDKMVIGYAGAYLFRPAHYNQRIFAQLDSLFVHPDWRSRRVGLHLIDRLEKEARVRGATRLLMHAKPGSRLEKLLERLEGFVVEETIWRMEL